MSSERPQVEQIRRWRRAVSRNGAAEKESTNRRRRRPPIEVRRFAGPGVHREQLDHLRVAHLTDMHFGRVTPLRIQQMAVELTNAAHADLVVITGDFVCHSQAYLDQLGEVLSKIEAPTIGVLGNHDYWSGAEGVLRTLDRAGVEVLRNANTTLTLRHQPLQVVGLDDAYTGHADREAATKGLRADRPTIALSHIAEEADALWDKGAPLVLSGHTHAGQVTLAGLHELSIGRVAGHKYVHGLYGRRAPQGDEGPKGGVYVGAGIGASVMPIRLGDRGRRELALFELGANVGDFEEHHEEQPPLPGREPSDKLKAKRAEMVRRKRERRERRQGGGQLVTSLWVERDLFGGRGEVRVEDLLGEETLGAFAAVLRCELEAGGKVGRHVQEHFPEIVIGLSGEGMAHIDDASQPLVAGSVVRLPLGSILAISNRSATEPLRYMIVKTQP